ncbi:MAG: hemin ABC transporter substrate-binding protein [Flavobacteriales bacterium]|nr:hemin ABC transporter substrate-binding protein [Flavobacteriales bacterium]|tara:strand:+ start:1082 stop:1948 length:867 start_codon:yes stop_codon:yes gene_type:complete
MNYKLFAVSVFIGLLFVSCQEKKSVKNESNSNKKTIRIVSLNGALSEIIYALGYESNLVATDVTSNYPESIHKLPKVGHNRSIQAEGILAQNPDVVVGIQKELNPKVIKQIKASGIRVVLFNQEHSIEGTKKLIQGVKDSLNFDIENDSLNILIDQSINKLEAFEQSPKVLFIYARGAGTILVAGKNTQMDQMISIAGGKNAVDNFESFKPLTAEAIVTANPDVILMFTTGAQSLNGVFDNVPGILQTNAGKNKRIITMDGQYLSGFGPRVGKAALELNEKLGEIFTK